MKLSCTSYSHGCCEVDSLPRPAKKTAGKLGMEAYCPHGDLERTWEFEDNLGYIVTSRPAYTTQ